MEKTLEQILSAGMGAETPERERVTPWSALAHAVIACAVVDLTDGRSPRHRADAAEFLETGASPYSQWLGYERSDITRMYERLCDDPHYRRQARSMGVHVATIRVTLPC